eukprot:COSAG01_NODE_37696_length_500_cov_0.660848_1_plen_75_part_10
MGRLHIAQPPRPTKPKQRLGVLLSKNELPLQTNLHLSHGRLFGPLQQKALILYSYENTFWRYTAMIRGRTINIQT